MSGNKTRSIDLSYLVPSFALESDLTKQVFFAQINEAPLDTEFKNLFDVLVYCRKKLDNLTLRLTNFKKNLGLSQGVVFPEPTTSEFTIMNFLELFNYAVESEIEKSFAQIRHDKDAELALVYYQGKLSLAFKNSKGLLSPAQNPVAVDYINGETAYRVNANVRSEAAVKAVMDKKIDPSKQYVLDATAGFGQDSMLFANAGMSVLMFERNVLVALLLADGLRRLKEHLAAQGNKELNVNLRFPVSIVSNVGNRIVKNLNFTSVYLDPMYPHTNSRAKVNKNMQLIQQLVGQDEDADELLVAAKNLNTNRIVVKRPKSAPYLNNETTSDAVTTKAHRLDMYYVGKCDQYNIRPLVGFTRKDVLEFIRNYQVEPEHNLVNLDNLVLCRKSLNRVNGQQEVYYAEAGKYHSAVTVYSRLLKSATIVARVLSYEEYLTYREQMLQQFNFELPGDELYRYHSYLHNPELRDKVIEILANKVEAKLSGNKKKTSKTTKTATADKETKSSRASKETKTSKSSKTSKAATKSSKSVKASSSSKEESKKSTKASKATKTSKTTKSTSKSTKAKASK
ncbi:class I SAM-dependent methyltransferase [Psittacicella hinzii]|uniref:Ribosomal RNA small subunit methyltransferase J n=1 Tax=Psittacicella hinzii TaxID=2028575 RepID=A0A3A1YJ53_9GAMM|nr:class I SAM-dependent methyltransferase [Psittacicella hinzii]RIY37466.1 hypothetical protein CKF58_04920 [Psittacicella hinzii]